ncbi:DUF937 domain-containing protein [Qipengyuania sediminis]|uniref:DUF937 domain-containing protein n=1 Tax=Qipengyuania sediminis TaxID=1532023 RepID=UPI00105A4BCA|nr:DUF937 domain-containing protein [Qipengyuania sediminis]
MTMSQALLQSGAIDAMARELGVDSRTAQTAAGALLPAIVAGLGRNHTGPGGARSHSGGLADILGGLAGGGGGGLGGGLLDQVLGPQPTPTKPGNDILGQIFGNKDVSRGVADEVAHSTGLDAGLLKKMLPMLAMAVVGMMLKRGGTGAGGLGGGGGPGGALGGALGGPLGGILGQVVAGMARR